MHYPAIRNWPTMLFGSRIANCRILLHHLFVRQGLHHLATKEYRQLHSGGQKQSCQNGSSVVKVGGKDFFWESSFHSRDKKLCSLQCLPRIGLMPKCPTTHDAAVISCRSVWARVPVAVSTVHVRVRLLWP